MTTVRQTPVRTGPYQMPYGWPATRAYSPNASDNTPAVTNVQPIGISTVRPLPRGAKTPISDPHRPPSDPPTPPPIVPHNAPNVFSSNHGVAIGQSPLVLSSLRCRFNTA